MAITKSAKKATRAAARRKVFNDRRRRAFREVVKKIDTLVRQGSHAEASRLLPAAYKAIDKAVKRKVLEKNTAARKKSRIARVVARAAKK